MADKWRRLRPKHPYVTAGLAVGTIVCLVVVLAVVLGGRGGAEQAAADSLPVSAATVTEGGGQPRSPRIVGGKPAELSFIASFGGRTHACHGLLVDPQHLVTTAGCIERAKAYPVTVGGPDLDGEGGVARKISDFRIHSLWNPDDEKSWEHDEAVVKLDRPVENVKPVCLAAKGSVFPGATRATLYGWGRVGPTEVLPAPRTLQAVNMTTMDHGQCKQIYRSQLTDDMICAVDDAGGPAICQGDSGAPLLVKDGDDFILLVSNIRGPYDCVSQNRPSVFLTHDDAFIEGAIKDMGDPPQVTQCGIRNTVPDVRVENGQVSAPHSSPWVGYLEWEDGSFREGATLIHPSFVVSDYARPGLFVVLGAHNRSSTSEPTQRIMIEKVYRHPNSTWPNYPYLGMKLVKLAHPAKFTEHIRPICLPKPGYVLPAGSECLFSGWGDNKKPAPWVTDVLREGLLTTITTDQCRRDFADPAINKYITNATICTAGDNHKPHPSMMDIGGSLSCEEKDSLINNLHGVLYWETYDGHPSLFHDASPMLPWINEMLSADASSKVCFKKFEG